MLKLDFFFPQLSGLKREPPRDPAVTDGQKWQTDLCLEAQGFLLCILALQRFISVNTILWGNVYFRDAVLWVLLGQFFTVHGFCEFPVYFQWERGQRQNGGSTKSSTVCQACAEKSWLFSCMTACEIIKCSFQGCPCHWPIRSDLFHNSKNSM